VTTRVLTHPWLVSIILWIPCFCMLDFVRFLFSFLFLLLLLLLNLWSCSWYKLIWIFSCSARQVGSHSSFMIGIRQNSLEGFDIKYFKELYYSLVFEW
jgi:hypothetical protein